jgi:hypothetical protein
MSAARTETGIVEWARRVRAARTTELRLANVLADLIATAPTAAEKIALARAARRNGWYAELWDGVVPVLHDRDRELVAVRPWVDLEDGLGADPQAGVAAAVDVPRAVPGLARGCDPGRGLPDHAGTRTHPPGSRTHGGP